MEQMNTVRSHADNNKHSGRWSPEERARFLEGLLLFNSNTRALTEYVGTRTARQVNAYLQRWLKREAESNEPKGNLSPNRTPEQIRAQCAVARLTDSASLNEHVEPTF